MFVTKFLAVEFETTLYNSVYIQCNPDLTTSYFVTNPDLVTILQKTIFLVQKTSHLVAIWYFLHLRFSDTKFGLFGQKYHF